jgi:hypothetical protein
MCLDKLEFYKTLNQSSPAIKTFTNYHVDLGNFVTVEERFGAGFKEVRIGLDKLEAIKYSSELKNPVF